MAQVLKALWWAITLYAINTALFESFSLGVLIWVLLAGMLIGFELGYRGGGK